MTIRVREAIIPQNGGVKVIDSLTNLGKKWKNGEMNPQKVKILSSDKCQIINPYSEYSKNSQNKRVKNQDWLSWEQQHGMPVAPHHEGSGSTAALKEELRFESLMATWTKKVVRKIANHRFQPEEKVFLGERQVLFQSYTYKKARILYRQDGEWIKTTVKTGELSKFKIGSTRQVREELEDGSLVLI